LPEAQALEAWAAAVARAARHAVAGVTGAAAFKVQAEPSAHARPVVYVVDEAYVARAERRVGREEAIWRHWEHRIDLLEAIDEPGLHARRSLLQDDDLYAPHFPAVLQRHLDAGTWPDGAVALAERPPPPAAPAGREAPLRDEAELAELIAHHDLPPELIETARWGLALVEGPGRSRLGGAAALPYALPEHDGLPLTHLMTIALDELPDVPGREHLPRHGTLVFLACLDDEPYEALPADDPRVRIDCFGPDVVLTPRAGDPDYTLEERAVRLEPVLTLPHRREDLPLELQLSYEQLVEALAEVTPGLWQPGHLLLGHPNFAHVDPRAPGEINVMHYGYDFEHSLDGRHFTVHGRPEDVLAGRWERLTVTPQH